MRLLAIDGDSLLRTMWEASDDASKGGVYRRVLHRIVQSISQWERSIVAFDGGPGGGVGGFRRAQVPEYKANRTDPGAPFRDQRQRLIDALRYERCAVIIGPIVKVPVNSAVDAEGYCEADDILAWAAHAFAGHFEDAAQIPAEAILRVVSNDGDVEALASDCHPPIEIFKLGKSREEPVYTARRIDSERGVEPGHIPLLKALCGDKSDNYAGFPGIGDKTGAMLIRYHGGDPRKIIEEAPEDESIPPKELNKSQRAALREGGLGTLMKGLWLATLRHELPLDFDALVVNPPEPEPRPKDYGFAKQGADGANKPEQPVAPSVALEVRQQATASLASADINPFALQPGNLDSLYDLALALHRSGLYSHLPNTEAIMAVILEANERKVPAATALRNAYFVPGSANRPPRLGWSATYIAGLVLSSGKADIFELIPNKCNDTMATIRFKRRGREDGEFPYTIDDAKRAGLLAKDVWTKFTKNMLRAAATREAARAYFPDVVSGVYMPDELRERDEHGDDLDAANV